MRTHCPKCGHTPLPENQALPTACPSCGVILAKVGQALPVRTRSASTIVDEEPSAWRELLLPSTLQPLAPLPFWLRVVMLSAFAFWGCVLIAQDYRTGEIGTSFIHRPLLVFHEAGHVIFRLLGEWMMVLGGTLGQLIMPALLGAALLTKNNDPFGASIGLWLMGVSLLDIAPYMFDAMQPQLILLSGATGEEGGHDWIFLFNSLGLLSQSQWLGAFTHKLGALVTGIAMVWGARVLWLQRPR